jgi:hypothetical protein
MLKENTREALALSNEQKTIVTHLHVGFENILMLESGLVPGSGRTLESALILAFASLPGTVRVDVTLGPFTRKDFDALARREILLALFAGERIVSTLLGTLVAS